jgi:hydroxymethylpyrimidine pyrophosphatase-like HAD family hydrolase
MRYLALACDYDGTLASQGLVGERTVEALERLRATGRRVILVTGREIEDLRRVFPRVELFDRVVAENGAVVYRPETKDLASLAEPPPPGFVEALRERGVEPLSVGHVIVATWHPQETAVLEVIREMGLELQVIFNKGAVMILPTGVNKAFGLQAALTELGLSPHNIAGVGDAENDHAFLRLCECSVAVTNALPALKETSDITTEGRSSEGVVELVEMLVEDDLAGVQERLRRHDVVLGKNPEGGEVAVHPYGSNMLVAGPSGSGKSTLVSGFVERLADAGYQFCVVDPEGDYENLEHVFFIGSAKTAAEPDEVMRAVEDPATNVVVNLLGIPIADRPQFFDALLPRIQELRARTGRPHWIVVDEAHHMLHPLQRPPEATLPVEIQGLLLISVHPDRISPAVRETCNHVVAVGGASEVLAVFEGGEDAAKRAAGAPEGTAVLWSRGEGSIAPFVIAPSRFERTRHTRKYAEGELGPDRSFYFRGPEGKLNLRAQNLMLFSQIAEGVDDETWLHHLRQGDYSRWFRDAIKDDALADEVAKVEASDGSVAESRRRILEAVSARYTAPE